MQYKTTKKIIIDQHKLEILFRIGCPDKQIIELLKTGTFTHTGDVLIDDTLDSLLDYKYFNNKGWGGKREGAGRKPQKSEKNNQVENQVENQVCNQDTDKDIDKDIDYNSRNNIKNISTTHDNFIPPTLEEVLEYAKQQNEFAGMGGFKCSKNQVMNFYDFYTGQGWITSGNIPIKNWQTKLRGWCRKDATATEKTEQPIQA